MSRKLILMFKDLQETTLANISYKPNSTSEPNIKPAVTKQLLLHFEIFIWLLPYVTISSYYGQVEQGKEH